jgi:hypothetical protein
MDLINYALNKNAGGDGGTSTANLAKVATTGNYTDLKNAPLKEDTLYPNNKLKAYTIDRALNVNNGLTLIDNTGTGKDSAFFTIENMSSGESISLGKTDLKDIKEKVSSLSTVAITGNYGDLQDTCFQSGFGTSAIFQKDTSDYPQSGAAYGNYSFAGISCQTGDMTWTAFDSDELSRFRISYDGENVLFTRAGDSHIEDIKPPIKFTFNYSDETGDSNSVENIITLVKRVQSSVSGCVQWQVTLLNPLVIAVGNDDYGYEYEKPEAFSLTPFLTLEQGTLSSESSGFKSIAVGNGTVATGSSQLVCGSYNEAKEDAYFIVGGGTEDNKKNILEIDSQGNLKITGDLTAVVEKEEVTLSSLLSKIKNMNPLEQNITVSFQGNSIEVGTLQSFCESVFASMNDIYSQLRAINEKLGITTTSSTSENTTTN